MCLSGVFVNVVVIGGRGILAWFGVFFFVFGFILFFGVLISFFLILFSI